MSLEFFFRIIGMIVLGVSGSYLGIKISGAAQQDVTLWASVTGLLGALIGLVLAPYVTTRPARYVRNLISQMPSQVLLAAMIGLVVGLVVAALLSLPLSLLPDPLNKILPFIGVVIFGWLGISVFVMREHDIFGLWGGR